MRVIALKAFRSSVHGTFAEGQVFEIDDSVAGEWKRSGLVAVAPAKAVHRRARAEPIAEPDEASPEC